MHSFKSYESSDHAVRYVNGRRVKPLTRAQISPSAPRKRATAVSCYLSSNGGVVREVTSRE